MSGLTLIYCPFSSAAEAHRVSVALIEEGLVACANRLAACVSHYPAHGEIATEEEHPVLFKTGPDKVEAAMARIAELHCYDIPAILSWQAEAVHAPFADWVSHQLRK